MISSFRRSGLLLSLAVSITVPGLLALLAAIGHEQQATAHAVPAGSGGAAASRAQALAAAGIPQAAARAPGQVALNTPLVIKGRAGIANILHTASPDSGASGTNRLATAEQQGLRLLDKAAGAGLSTTYQGVEMVAQWGVSGTTTAVSNVWHKAGGTTVTQTSDAAGPNGSQPYVAYDGNRGTPEGVFGVTRTLVPLMEAHYQVVYAGTGSVVNRSALIVELRRADGSTAARFWLDRRTMLPLRREVYDSAGHLISEDSFIQVQFGALAARKAASALATPAWAAVSDPARLLGSLNAKGWSLPAALPDGLSLYAGARAAIAGGQVTELSYSDGLSVVSLFVQPGTLPATMNGWQVVTMGSRKVYAAGYGITWAGNGFVYTVLADAPPQTLADVVYALPQEAPPGFLVRLSRGLSRLAALIDPFR